MLLLPHCIHQNLKSHHLWVCLHWCIWSTGTASVFKKKILSFTFCFYCWRHWVFAWHAQFLYLWHTHGPSCLTARGILVPRSGIEPDTLPLEGRFSTAGPPRRSPESVWFITSSPEHSSASHKTSVLHTCISKWTNRRMNFLAYLLDFITAAFPAFASLRETSVSRTLPTTNTSSPQLEPSGKYGAGQRLYIRHKTWHKMGT